MIENCTALLNSCANGYKGDVVSAVEQREVAGNQANFAISL